MKMAAEPKIELFNADWRDILPRYESNWFDLAIVDPEYGRKQHGGTNRSGYVKQSNGKKLYVKDGGYVKKDWDNDPVDQDYFDELFRVSKHQIIWGCNYFDGLMRDGRIVWDKCNQGSDQSDCEIAYNSLTERVDLFRYMWRGMMQGKSINEGHIQQGNKALNEKRIHPTQKPVALYNWLLQNYAKEGDKILDTHLGSGSIAIACYEQRFDLVACEIDEDYYTAMKKRYDEYRKQLQLFS